MGICECRDECESTCCDLKLLLRLGDSFQSSQPGPATLPLMHGISSVSSSSRISYTPPGDICTDKGILENGNRLWVVAGLANGVEASSGIAIDAGLDSSFEMAVDGGLDSSSGIEYGPGLAVEVYS